MFPGNRLGTPLFLIGITVAAALILKLFVIDAAVVPTRSMEPSLKPGDFILINKMIQGPRSSRQVPVIGSFFSDLKIPLFRKITRGDVLFFELPARFRGGESGQYYIKRCVGLAGDSILFENNRVEIVGHALFRTEEEMDSAGIAVPGKGDIIRLDTSMASVWKSVIEGEGHSVEVKYGSVYIDGQVKTGYQVEKDYLFMLGDNFRSSYDSRSWGFLPEENVVGKAMMIYWSVDDRITDPMRFFSRIRWGRVGTLIK